LLVALAGCGSFEDPTIVIDLRALAMTAEPPEQVVPFDPANPPDDPEEAGLVDAEVCALIADPGASRRLRWEMTLCAPADDLRCDDDPEHPQVPMGDGVLDDPEEAADPQVACATLAADPALLLVIEDAIAIDSLAGFGGIDVMVQLEVSPEDGAAPPIFAAKRVRYAPLLPPDRVANTNPTLEQISILVEGGEPNRLPLGRCGDQPEPIRVAPGEQLELEPLEPEGVREDYVVPTFDGGSRSFTESLTYQWLAGDGEWSRSSTGGPRDLSGMYPPLSTKWRAPEVTEPTDVRLWLVQRDERLGAAWFEACARVTP
jgi:hypothetical protein